MSEDWQVPAMSDELYFEQLARESEQESGPDAEAPARLLSQTYTALIKAQQASGPLQDVTATKAAGSPLCVFEDLVQITPAGEQAKQMFYCNVCHARILAENMDKAPIWWPHCPYAEFQK